MIATRLIMGRAATKFPVETGRALMGNAQVCRETANALAAILDGLATIATTATARVMEKTVRTL